MHNSFTYEISKEEVLEEIKQKFKDHCDPQRNVIFERTKCNIIVQKGKFFDSFLSDLRKAVKTTEYFNQDEMVRVIKL